MRSLMLLCDVVGRYGGTERYWETVLTEFSRNRNIFIAARRVEPDHGFDGILTEIAWADEQGEPSLTAADRVAAMLTEHHLDTVITANVFDPLVLRRVRECARHWVARIHDYRPFCPNGNKVFPQFQSVCHCTMGVACMRNAVLRGCMKGPRLQSFRQVAQRVAVRDALTQADAILISSGYVRDICIQNGLPEERLVLTPPPLPEAAYTDNFTIPQSRAILFAGRLTEEKGLRSLLRALSTIERKRRPRLIVAGSGDRDEDDARHYADQHGLDVTWLGWIDADALRAAMDASLAVIVPSLWPEPFGLVGIEAQARGRPAIAYDVGGISDWIEGAGIAVARGDERALAHAIERLIDEPTTWQTFATAARAKSERHRLRPHVAHMNTIIDGTYHLKGDFNYT